MLVRRGPRWACFVVGLVAGAGLVTGCGSSTASTSGKEHQPVPSNVTLRESPETPRLPANLVTTSGELADLVDFHEEDFSGSWFDVTGATMHIGVATPAGRELLDERGLLNNSSIVVEHADRSLAEGQRFADAYVRHSRLRQLLVGWATLPQGDGIDLFVHSDHLTPEQLDELGDLPMRVVVFLGQNGGTLT